MTITSFTLIISNVLKNNILAETKYGTNFASIVGKENIYGVQFHLKSSPKD